MTRLALAVPVVVFALSGCGPMTAPMADRLPEEVQKEFDAAWDRALTPVDRLDHQVLLDAFVGTGAYQRGVDKLLFRSEKRYAGGLVVMEVHFDRATPADDRFEVTVTDLRGQVVRHERYGRAEVESAYRDLFTNEPPPLAPGETEDVEAAARRAAHEARVKRITGLFPMNDGQPK